MRHRSARAILGTILAVALALGAAAASHAHLAVSRRSLRMLVAEADLVVRARLLEVDDSVAAHDPKNRRRPALRIEVLEVIKGPSARGEQIQLFQHGHGVAEYLRGEEALFFLRDLGRSRELEKLHEDGTVRWYSNQEHDDDYVLSDRSRGPTVAAARRYAAIEQLPPNERDAALRKITKRLLTSGDPGLARSALRDLGADRNRPLVTDRDVSSLLLVIEGERMPIDIRVDLLGELDRRRLVEADGHWVRLLRTTRGNDRLAVIRAAGKHPSQAVNAELESILMGADPALRSAAAVALGSPGNNEAVAPLSTALNSGDSRTSMAAIRALGRIGTAEAREILRSAAESHADPAVRRRAQAEVRLLEKKAPQGR